MNRIISYFKGLLAPSGTLNGPGIVTKICQHIIDSVTEYKTTLVFDSVLYVLLKEDTFRTVEDDLGVIFQDVRDITYERLYKMARKYPPSSVPFDEPFTIQFSSFNEDDDLSEILGKEVGEIGAMYIMSRRHERGLVKDDQMRITKVSKMSRVIDTYSQKRANENGYLMRTPCCFTSTLGAARSAGRSMAYIAKTGAEAKAVDAWGKLVCLGTTRFAGGDDVMILHDDVIRVGGRSTLPEGSEACCRLAADTSRYVVISREDGKAFISGTGLLNGSIHLTSLGRALLPDRSKILLGDEEIMFNYSTSIR